MTDRPIIFSAPMVRALLDGRKTMTRRLAWENGTDMAADGCYVPRPSPWQHIKTGDRLWVRESFYRSPGDSVIWPVVGNAPPAGDAWAWGRHPSIHMPRWASRLTLTVTAVKIERLQDISEADARAEGFTAEDSQPGLSAVGHFVLTWESLHGSRSWDANPEVVAISFTVERKNIDALTAAA